jgi:hypothetical protein
MVETGMAKAVPVEAADRSRRIARQNSSIDASTTVLLAGGRSACIVVDDVQAAIVPHSSLNRRANTVLLRHVGCDRDAVPAGLGHDLRCLLARCGLDLGDDHLRAVRRHSSAVARPIPVIRAIPSRRAMMPLPPKFARRLMVVIRCVEPGLQQHRGSIDLIKDVEYRCPMFEQKLLVLFAKPCQPLKCALLVEWTGGKQQIPFAKTSG